MALTRTSLSAACTASDTSLSVTSTTSGFPAVGVLQSRQLMRIDNEYMLVDNVPVSGTCKVLQRGYNGTVAVPHENLAVVSTSPTTSDFGDNPVGGTVNQPPYFEDILTIGVDTTFTAAGTLPTATTLPIPTRNTTYVITKASAAAITLISATSAQMGLKLTFINGVAAANTITYTPGFLGDTTSTDVATSASKVGATFVCMVGYTGLWGAINSAATVTNWTVG